MSLIYVHRDEEARVEFDLVLDPSIDSGQDGGRWDPSWEPYVEDCGFRVVGVRLLDAKGQTTDELAAQDGTLPPGAAEALARELKRRYVDDKEFKAAVDRFVLTMQEVCPL